MSRKINLMKDAVDGKPMLVEQPSWYQSQKKFYWRSWDYIVNPGSGSKFGNNPPDFTLLFSDPGGDFLTYVKSSEPAGVAVSIFGDDFIQYKSVAKTAGGEDCRQVYIEFEKGGASDDLPNIGFRYEVDMAGKKMDPRVRPR